MNPIYKEYIEFLENKGVDKKFEEGYYWLDNQIIKAFDTDGNIHKVLRIHVDDDLNVSFKKYKEETFEIESWYDTANRYKENINNLEEHSLNLIEEAKEKYKGRQYAVPYSTGKDSSVTLHLVKKSGIDPLVIFNNTTIDVADTYLHINAMDNVVKTIAEQGFYIWRKDIHFTPTRFGRACCTVFKENAMIEHFDDSYNFLFFMGMRNEESNARSGYTDYWKNEKWGKRNWDACLPIREWSELEIWLYILLNNIEINNKYRKGYGRVGCAIVCPFYSKSTWVLDKYWYPFLYERWHKILDEDFNENKKACILNCTNKEYHSCWSGGVYRETATKEVIEEFSEKQGLALDIAEKYFDKHCDCCNKKLKKDDIALSMKYNGRGTNNFKCKACLAKDLGVKTKELLQKIKDFKSDGCDLF